MRHLLHKVCNVSVMSPKCALYVLIGSAIVLPGSSVDAVANYAGMITCLQGDAWVTLSGTRQRADVGTEFHMGDRIESTAGAILIIEMSDSAIVRLGERSKLMIGDYQTTGGPSRRGVLILEEGLIFVKVGSIATAGDGAFKIATPDNISISAARTGHTPTQISGRLAGGQLTVRLWQGERIVVSNEGGETTLELPNTETSIDGVGSAPVAARPVGEVPMEDVFDCGT